LSFNDEKSMVREIIASAITVILLVIIFFIAFHAAARGRTPLAVVSGISMNPLYSTGDLVVVVHKSPGDIKVGDVIVYSASRGFIIHRVKKVIVDGKNYYYRTQGDNNLGEDLPYYVGDKGVPYGKVIGVVAKIGGHELVIPYLGYLSLLAKS